MLFLMTGRLPVLRCAGCQPAMAVVGWNEFPRAEILSGPLKNQQTTFTHGTGVMFVNSCKSSNKLARQEIAHVGEPLIGTRRAEQTLGGNFGLFMWIMNKTEVLFAGGTTMTVSLPFTLTTLSDAPPDSFAAQQYRAANGYDATERTASGTSSTSSASSEEDDEEDDFAGALATAMNMASKVSSNPVMPQAAASASATDSGAVSASAVSPVMPPTTATAQQSASGEGSGVSATAVMPGMTPASSGMGELTAEGVASAVVPDASQTLAATTNNTTTDLSSELTPLRILMLQRFRVPVANTSGENATMQEVTQVSIVSTDARIASDDTAALIKATQSVLNNGLPPDFVSASAIIMPNPDEVTMELAEELVDAESSGKSSNGGSVSSLFSTNGGGGRLDSLRGLLNRLSERLNVALENDTAQTAGAVSATAYQSAMTSSGVSSVMAGASAIEGSAVRTAEGVSAVMPELPAEAVSAGNDTQSQTSSAPVMAGTNTSPLTSMLTDSLRQPLSTQVSQAIYQHVILNNARDNSSMTVRLDPPELGELVIRLSRTDDGIAVKVSAREPVTMDMLLARGNEIEAELSDQNLNLAGIEFLSPDAANGGFNEWLGQDDRAYPEYGTRRSSTISQSNGGAVSSAPVVASASGFGQLSFRA